MIVEPKMKIGEFLIERNFLTSKQVNEILDCQEHELSDRFGEIALTLDYITVDAIKHYEAYINAT